MKRVKIDLSEEKRILANMITNTSFLRGIRDIHQSNLFETSFARTISTWVWEYYSRTSSCPGRDIQDIYLRRKSEIHDEDDVELIADYLTAINTHYQEIEINNVLYEVEKAEKYFKLRSLEKLASKINKAVVNKSPADGEKLVAEYKRIEKPTGSGIDLFENAGSIKSAFDFHEERLFKFPGVLGEQMGYFCRGDFVAFLAPIKTGKCMTGDSQVLLPDGRLQSLSQVIGNKEPFCVAMENHTLKKMPISNWYRNGIKPVYRIITKSGRAVTATTNHPFFKFKEGWKSIDEGLSVGDFIAAPSELSFFGDNEIPEDHVKLMAYLLTEGGFQTSSISFTKKDPEVAAEFKKIIYNLGDTVRSDGIVHFITKKYKGPQLPETKKLLNSYNFKMSKSIYKEIPDIIFTLKKEQLQTFLNIMFSCDGSIFENGIEYCSGSEKMVRQVAHLLLRFGILCKIRSKKVNDVLYWILAISDAKNYMSFIDQIGFSFKDAAKIEKFYNIHKSKRQRSFLKVIPKEYKKEIKQYCIDNGIVYGDLNFWTDGHLTDFQVLEMYERTKLPFLKEYIEGSIFYDRIVAIEYAGEQETFDITVPGLHNFIANDICCHNTFYLFEFAKYPALFGLNAVFYSLEMTQAQMIRRSWKSLVGQPLKAGLYDLPTFIDEGAGKYSIGKRSVQYSGMDLDEVEKKQELYRTQARGRLKMQTFPAGQGTVSAIETDLANLEYYDGFIPDVIVIDYADIIKQSGKEYRHGLNDIWLSLRGWGQSRNCCVVTVSQINKSAFTRDVRSGDVAEDARKLGHVTQLYALNQTLDEKKIGAHRVEPLLAREGQLIPKQVCILENRDVGRIYLDSRLVEDVIDYKNGKLSVEDD